LGRGKEGEREGRVEVRERKRQRGKRGNEKEVKGKKVERRK